MPKENKSTSRRNKRQSLDSDNRGQEVTVTSERESTKSVAGSKRYSPFQRESSRRDSRVEEQNVRMTSSESLHSISGGIIGSGIKYIMFPLHLLRFCLLGISSVSEKLTVPKENQEPKNLTSSNKEEKEKKTSAKEDKCAQDDGTSGRRSSKERRRNSESGSYSETRNEELDEKDSKKRRKSDDEVFTDALVSIENDSDTSTDQWSSASSTMIMNMSVDYDNIDRCMSFSGLEEPMDVSMEEHIYEKPRTVIESPRDSCTAGNMFKSAPRFCTEEQDSNSSVDEEIARIFQKQCTSSEEENSSSYSKASSSKRDKMKENNFLCHKKRNSSTSGALESKKPEEVNKERKKKAASGVVHTKRKTSQDYDRSEKHRDRKNETEPCEEKRSSKQDSSNKSKTKLLKSPVKIKESKRRDIKYKETATQTDSAFSDDDVEMVPIDVKLLEKQFYYKHAAYRSHPNLYQNREMGHEFNYVADNEDSIDRLIRNSRHRISSCSTSSSSTDLGFDEHVFVTPEADIGTVRWNGNTVDTVNSFRVCSRAPPGFPELPQNPPLSCRPNDWQNFELTSSTNNYSNQSIPTSGMVPRAPSPMRHLYYNYPEFMDLPLIVKSSKTLNNVTSNYYR